MHVYVFVALAVQLYCFNYHFVEPKQQRLKNKNCHKIQPVRLAVDQKGFVGEW